jgi:hypothetical protein
MARLEVTGRKVPRVEAARPGNDEDDEDEGDKPSADSKPTTAPREAAARAPPDDADALTVEEFCRRHRISRGAFYLRLDEMPLTYMVGTRRYISKEAAARWRREREELQQSA